MDSQVPSRPRRLIEMRALAPVPAGERQHWMSVTAIQAGYMVSITSLWTGSLIVAGMPLGKAIAAGTIGYLIVVGLCILMGIQGSDLGVPTVEAATAAFGELGSRFLVSGTIIVSTIGWFAINANLCGAAFARIVGETTGFSLPVQLTTLFWGAVMLSTAVFGFNGLKYLNMAGVPLMITVCVVGIWMAISRNGLGALAEYVPGREMTLIQAIGVVVGGYAVGAVTAADTTRYQRTRRDVVLSSTLGILPAGVALLWAGAVLAVVAGTEDLSIIFVGLGIPFLGLLALVFSTWPANAGNAYSAGLDVVKMLGLPDRHRAVATACCGALGVMLSLFNIVEHFTEIMTWVGIVVTPLCGAMVADYWTLRRACASRWRPAPGFNPAGVLGWLLGAGSAVLIELGSRQGVTFLGRWLLPSVTGVLVAYLTCLAVSRLRSGRDALTGGELDAQAH